MVFITQIYDSAFPEIPVLDTHVLGFCALFIHPSLLNMMCSPSNKHETPTKKPLFPSPTKTNPNTVTTPYLTSRSGSD